MTRSFHPIVCIATPQAMEENTYIETLGPYWQEGVRIDLTLDRPISAVIAMRHTVFRNGESVYLREAINKHVPILVIERTNEESGLWTDQARRNSKVRYIRCGGNYWMDASHHFLASIRESPSHMLMLATSLEERRRLSELAVE